MTAKSEFLQIRVTPRDKATLKRLARAAGMDVSAYVLSRALPPARLGFAAILARLAGDPDHRYVLAELNDFLTALAPAELQDAVANAELGKLSPFFATTSRRWWSRLPLGSTFPLLHGWRMSNRSSFLGLLRR